MCQEEGSSLLFYDKTVILVQSILFCGFFIILRYAVLQCFKFELASLCCIGFHTSLHGRVGRAINTDSEAFVNRHFDNSFEQIELIELIRQVSTETLIVIQVSVVIFQTTPHMQLTMHSIIFQTSL